MWYKRLTAIILGTTCVHLLGCVGRERSVAAAPPPPAPARYGAPLPLAQEAAAPASVSMGTSVQLAAAVDESKPAPEARILIYTANVAMSVADMELSLEAVQRIAKDAGGYMQSLTAESIIIRVPATTFFDVLEQLRPLGVTLTRNIEAQDITDEYVDLQLRLRNAEALLKRFEAILQKAQTVRDTLEVEKELNRVREEIERIKGKLALLDKQVRFSTITVHFVKGTAPQVRQHRPETPFPWLNRLGVETVLNIVD